MLALALGGFGIGTTEFVAMGLLPEMASGLGVSEPVAGHVISAYALGVVVGAPLIAALTARVPRRTLLIALMVAFTVGNAASVFAPSYTTLMMARFVAGLPHGAYFGVAALVAAHLAEPGKRAKAVAMVMMGLSVANVIGVPVAAWIGQALGWRSAFALVAVIGVATVASLFVWIPRLDGMPVTNPITELGALGRVQVWMTLIVGMAVSWIVRRVVAVAVAVPMPHQSPAPIGAALGLKGFLHGLHDQVQARQHLGQHRIGFQLEGVRLQLQRHMPVAQVVGPTHQVKGAAVLRADLHLHQRLRLGHHTAHRAVFGHQHIATAHHGAARQEHAQWAAAAVGGVKAAFLAGVPVQRDAGGALHQHLGQALALGHAFGADDHVCRSGHRPRWKL